MKPAYGATGAEPSFWRVAIVAAAVICPTSVPASRCAGVTTAGMVERAAAISSSKFSAGCSERSTSKAAWSMARCPLRC
ncbi:hypothetical protein [Streptomyces narbonensis]